MDQDYLSKIDDIEAQNRSYLAEIEEQKQQKKTERKKVAELMASLEQVEEKLQHAQLEL